MNNFLNDKNYKSCIEDLIKNKTVLSMSKYIQHGKESCLEHSLTVSYKSYLFCKKHGLDYRAAARGGILHDFFLYDWHKTMPKEGLHGFVHPKIALKNAMSQFKLTTIEQDIIVKHMWPLTPAMPKYPESFVVSFMDKLSSFSETFYGIFEIRLFKKLNLLLNFQIKKDNE